MIELKLLLSSPFLGGTSLATCLPTKLWITRDPSLGSGGLTLKLSYYYLKNRSFALKIIVCFDKKLQSYNYIS